MYVLGVDFGGGASKATLLDEKGRVCAAAAAEYPTDYGSDGKAEQNPADWYAAACKNIRAVTKDIDVRQVACLCFDAATHTAVLTDERFRPLRPAVYWTDTRCITEKARLAERYGDRIFSVCKHRPDTIWTLPQLMYIKRTEPDTFARVRHVCFAKDYVRHLFTGDFITDGIEAEGSMLFDFDGRCWDGELLALAGLDTSVMPEIVSPLDVTGRLTETATRDTGLPASVRVICGSTDTAMEVFAAGGVRAGDTTVKLATAGRICVVADRYVPDGNIVNYSHVKEGLYYPGSATKSCAASLRWFRDAFGGDYAAYDRAAADIPAGCGGLLFHPYLNGELTPYAEPELAGAFTGICAEHGKAHFARAVMEGAALSLLDCADYLKERGLPPADTARIIGGGAKSALWRGILADVLGMTLVSTEHNDSSFGSAMCAGIAAGFFAGFDDAARTCIRVMGTTGPDADRHAVYRQIFARYKSLADFFAEQCRA